MNIIKIKACFSILAALSVTLAACAPYRASTNITTDSAAAALPSSGDSLSPAPAGAAAEPPAADQSSVSGESQRPEIPDLASMTDDELYALHADFELTDDEIDDLEDDLERRYRIAEITRDEFVEKKAQLKIAEEEIDYYKDLIEDEIERRERGRHGHSYDHDD